VLLVVLAAAGVGFLSGGHVGVDVLFVVSGFLITALLIGEAERSGRIRLAGFYARRARRLLPAASTVVVASLGLALFLLPKSRWSATGWDAVASGLYLMNWRLAGEPAGHLGAAGPGLLRHFWVLAVGVQFYVIWPVLMVGIAWLVRRHRHRLRHAVLGTAVALLLASVTWAVLLTPADPVLAYLGTGTRIWQFALGGALAAATPLLSRLAAVPAAVLGWSGLVAIGVATVTAGPAGTAPGPLAALPAVGAAALLAGGVRVRGASVGTVLGWRPFAVAGLMAYPLFLWHWPLLAVARVRFDEPTPVATAGVLLLAVPLAVLTHWGVERPVRRMRGIAFAPIRAVRIAGAVLTVPVLAGMLFQFTAWPPPQPPLPAAIAPALTPVPTPSATPAPRGAAVLASFPRGDPAGEPVDRVDSIEPDPDEARNDLPDAHQHRCITAPAGQEVLRCVYGDRDGEFTVALAGDSHAAQWLPALQEVAAQRGWRLVTYLSSTCPYLQLRVWANGAGQPGCVAWFDGVLAEFGGDDRPDLLVTSGQNYQPVRDGVGLTGDEAREALVEGMRRTWNRMRTLRVPTVVLRDTPEIDRDMPECVSVNRERLSRCAIPRDEALEGGIGPAQREAAELSRTRLVDLSDAICPADRCAPVIGGVLVYRNASHLTATYARTLAPRLGPELDDVVN
jgi:peptidoglycan/LPS O-acetylase OafA/YrhL